MKRAPLDANLTKPCGECPFRRKAAPGYVGNDTPEHFIEVTLSDVPMPCHMTVDYEGEWELQVFMGDAEACAGARIFYANLCKRSRDPDTVPLPADRSAVFASKAEFLAHHSCKSDAAEAFPTSIFVRRVEK